MVVLLILLSFSSHAHSCITCLLKFRNSYF
uniref:Uncharacterized protein n=1 Tax=Rhizophora mucronata TaxID=61149 RepID=A0A2P2KR34_RHIMU